MFDCILAEHGSRLAPFLLVIYSSSRSLCILRRAQFHSSAQGSFRCHSVQFYEFHTTISAAKRDGFQGTVQSERSCHRRFKRFWGRACIVRLWHMGSRHTSSLAERLRDPDALFGSFLETLPSL